ncbi:MULTISPECIES: hypothetical protein [unclassified Escherichia]|uniref:hypothetical protein n=1 Tax=unclassified Escherichia TaxID=2608889 RepID=UPI001029F30D|nr:MULTISPECIES: hypothetical protein [unclassified Escherichia]RZM89780.1 hypothetical protein D9742_05040 [Escherichia sp. E1V33]TBR70877.1 hypothetical protein D9735_00535 [Escherichia sp. E1S7]
MNLTEISKEIEKIKYHISILGDIIDYHNHPVESLTISMDWNERNINRTHDIFEKYDEKLSNNEKLKWYEFENDLKDELDIEYQMVKQVILAFYKNHQWRDVCYQYALSFGPNIPAEFYQIIRHNN